MKPGFVWNPLLAFPRNALCVCKSGVKYKRCCLPKIKHAIPKEDAEKLKGFLP